MPPSDLEAEATVLSALLLDAGALDQVSFLQSKHFYADANRRIYQAAIDLRDEGKPIDVVSVAGYLRDREKLQAVGGSPYLAQLSDATPATAHVETHAKTIIAKWEVRQLIHAATMIAAEGYGDIGNLEDWKQEVDQRIFNATRSVEREERLVIIGDATHDAIKVVQERQQAGGVLLTGVTTGLPTLDARTGGLEAGNLYVMAARPGVGKTSVATGVAIACARGTHYHKDPEAIGDGVVFISVEMPKQQLAFRVLSQVARIDSVRLMRGHVSREQWVDMAAAQKKILKMPIVVEDSSDHTPASLRAAYRMGVRKLHERFGKQLKVRLMAIDYLQLLNSHGDFNNREQEIATISRATKQIAKDEGVAVLSLAQVNRDCEKRTDKRPQLSDLRESGAVEQDADVVMFLYREDYYRPKDQPKDGKAEIIVAKLRMGGGPGTVHCEFEPTTTTFYETSRNPDIEQLGDMFDDYLPGQSGEPIPEHWQNGDRD